MGLGVYGKSLKYLGKAVFSETLPTPKLDCLLQKFQSQVNFSGFIIIVAQLGTLETDVGRQAGSVLYLEKGWRGQR